MEVRPEKVLVTGGAGFIGSHLIESLLADGHEVVCVDSMNEYYDVTLKEKRLARFKEKVSFYQQDIADGVAFEHIVQKEKPTKIAHLAGQAGVRYSLEAPNAYGTSNVNGSISVLESARKHECFAVLASSSSVYGESKKIPFCEEDPLPTPASIYATTKRSMELLAESYHHLYHIPLTCLRFFTVYGPYGRPDMAPLKFAEAITKGEEIDVYNNGDMKRDFTYVSDIVHGFRLALDKPNGYQVYNLGNGAPVQLMDFISLLEAELGVEAKKNFLPMQLGDVPITYADTTKARDELGFESRTSIQDGVRMFVAWYREFCK